MLSAIRALCGKEHHRSRRWARSRGTLERSQRQHSSVWQLLQFTELDVAGWPEIVMAELR